MTSNSFNFYPRCLLFFFVTIATGISAVTHGATQWNERAKSNFSVYDKTQHVNNLGIRLYAKNENLILRFENGNSVLFKPSSSQFSHRILKNQSHNNEQLGRIETQNTSRIWHYKQNVKIEFLGSYPIAVSTDEHRVSLNYKQDKHVRANVSKLNYSPLTEEPAAIIGRMRALLAQAEQFACATENGNEQCTDPDAPLPVGFGTSQDSNELHINTRPSDCHSYFTAYPNIERGSAIEAALAHHPPYAGSQSGSHSFPVADYWNNGSVYVLISRDLTSSSYQPDLNPDGFYEQLIDDGENIQENLIHPLATDGQISQTSMGETTTLHENEAHVIYLDVVVQFGVMSEAQKDQFVRASEELLNLYGIIARLVMIP